MVELLDNLIQSGASLIAFLAAGVFYYRTRQQTVYLLASYLGSFMLGSFHWTLYLLLFDSTPQVFYVSELAWIVATLFLLSLELVLASKEEKKFRHPALLLVPAFCIPQLILYLTRGDILVNLLMVGLNMSIAYLALRGLIYGRKGQGRARDKVYFYAAVLWIIVLEFGLWTSSCFWSSETLSNPYFWIDFALSLSLLTLVPALKKAVTA